MIERHLAPVPAAGLPLNGAVSRLSPISDDRLRRLFDASVMGILIGNNSGAITEANDAFLSMIGYTRSDLLNGLIDWRALTPPEWLYRDERAIEEMAAHGSFKQYEKEYFRKDRTRVPVSLGGARLTGTDSEQICYVVDLSEIRRAENALRRSEARFRRLSDANVLGVTISRVSDWAIIEANDELLRMLGYTREEFVARPLRWTDLTPPRWHDASRSARAELLATGRFIPYEKEFYRKDGSCVPVLIGGARLDEADDEIVSYVLDLSEQRDATRRIEESERRYRILAEALPQIVMLTDANRRPIYVNRNYEEYTGLGLDDMPAKWLEVIHPDDLPAVAQARSTGLPYQLEYRLRRAADGVYRWHFARVLKITGSAGNDNWLATAMDIDDRKRAEDTLRFMERAATLLSRSLDLETTFETLLDLVVPEFGDSASICLRSESGAITTVAARHRDPSKAHLARAICGKEVLRESSAGGTLAAFRTGRPQLRIEHDSEDIRASIKDEYVPLFTGLGYGSVVNLPFFSGSEVFGSLCIVSALDRRRYSAADLPAFEELARRASFAIVNARRFEREHRVADMLQEAALPRKLPRVPGYAFDAYYQAGRREASIGGDWYDAFATPSGQLVISVGDVAGNGLHAAVLMGNVRQVLRAAAHASNEPKVMLDVADQTLRGEHDAALVTAFVAVVDPLTNAMTYASAGHVPALLRSPDGGVTALDTLGLPLGCRHLASGESRRVELSPGSRLLLYTDGLVEWSRNYTLGDELLRERFAEGGSADDASPARSLVESVLPRSGPRDDVAVLLVTLDERPAVQGSS